MGCCLRQDAGGAKKLRKLPREYKDLHSKPCRKNSHWHLTSQMFEGSCCPMGLENVGDGINSETGKSSPAGVDVGRNAKEIAARKIISHHKPKKVRIPNDKPAERKRSS